MYIYICMYDIYFTQRHAHTCIFIYNMYTCMYRYFFTYIFMSM